MIGEESGAQPEGEEASPGRLVFLCSQTETFDCGERFCDPRQSAAVTALRSSPRWLESKGKREWSAVIVSWSTTSGSDGAEWGEGAATLGTSRQPWCRRLKVSGF
jgi:hypothetical protein